MVPLIWDHLGEHLFPALVKQRDMALLKVHDYEQSSAQVAEEVFRLNAENRRLQSLVEAARRPETPKVFRAATPAEVRRRTEQAFAVEEKDV